AHRFTLSLDRNTAVALPGAPVTFDMVLQNTGSTATTYDFGVSGLPANVTGAFNRTSITLNPSDSIPLGSNRVTLTLTETGNQLIAAGFTVTVTPEGAAELIGSAQGTLTVRPAFIEVTEVD